MQNTIEVRTVKHLMETADQSDSYVIFLCRDGEIERVSEQGSSDDADMWIRLHEEARVRSGGPYFEILSFSQDRGVYDGRGEHISGDDDDAISEAIKRADEERTRFYEEKETEFGPSAWPIHR